MGWRRAIRGVLGYLTLTGMFVGCSQGVIVGAYPIATPSVTPAYFDDTTGSYWSAYVQIEGQDIPELWALNGLDYALISARVTIPSRDGTLVRNVPLFTVEEGTVKIETGADLLKRMPLQRGTREQVGFELRVTVLRNRKALDTARKILAHVDKVVEPFLGNYAIASKILESALPLIDQLADESELPASSAMTSVAAETLSETNERNGGAGVLYAYFLLPRANTHSAERVKAKAVRQVKPWLKEHLNPRDDLELVECSDKEGHLCSTNTPSGATPLPSLAELDIVYARGLRKLKANQFQNGGADLFGSLHTWTKTNPAKSTEAIAVMNQAVEELKDRATLQVTPTPPANESGDAGGNTGADPTGVHAPSFWTGRSADEEMHYIFYQAFWGAYELLEQAAAGNTTRYMDDRVNSVAYVTIKYKPYASVHDPAAILEPGSNCASLTGTEIDRIDRYLDDNEALFLAHDIRAMRDVLERARVFLELTRRIEKNDYADALDLLASDPQMERAWQEDPFDEPGRMRRSGSASNALDRCFTAQSRLPPYQQLYALVQAYRSRDTKDPSTDRLQTIRTAFLNFTGTVGESDVAFAEGDSLGGSLSASPLARSLYLEAKTLVHEKGDKPIPPSAPLVSRTR